MLLLPSICFGQRSKIDSLEQVIVQKNIDDRAKVLALNQLAEHYKSTLPSKSLKQAQAALEIAQKLQSPNLIALSISNIGEHYLDDGNYSKALATFRKAQQQGNLQDSIQAIILNKIGVSYYFQGQYKQALKFQQKALALLNASQNLRRGYILSAISYVYMRQGNYRAALDYHFKALEVRKKMNNPNELAKSYNSIGDFYQAQGNYLQAISYYQEALRTSKKVKSPKGIAISNSNLGIAYYQIGKLDSALYHQKKALQIKKKLKIRKEIAISYEGMADIYVAQKKYEKAKEYITQAMQAYRQLGNNFFLARNYNRLGKLLNFQKRYSESLEQYQTALALLQDIPPSPLHLQTHKYIYEHFLAQNEAEAFMKYFKRYQALDSSAQIDNINSEEIKKLQRKYEYESQERANALLQQEKALLQKNNQIKSLKLKQNQDLLLFSLFATLSLALLFVLLYMRYQNKQRLTKELQASEDDLQRLNQVKDRFLSILSHDLRSPLASFISFMSLLQVSEPEDLPDLKNVSERMQLSVQDTLNLLDNLLNWSRSQTDGIKAKPEAVPIAKILQESRSVLEPNAENKQIQLKMDYPEDLSIFIDPNMLRVIFNNLLSNAIKFTPEAGKIKVKVWEIDGEVKISVQDTGVGLADSEIERILSNQYLSKKGTQNEKGNGLGLWLCREFVKQNQGRFEIESQPGEGSTFTLSFPKLSDLHNAKTA